MFRCVQGLLLFCFYLTRSSDLSLFYSDFGILQGAVFPEIMHFPERYSLLNFFTGFVVLWIFHLSFLLSLLTMAFGIYPRFSAFLASVLHISFIHRNMAVAYGIDAIATFFLLYLCFAETKKTQSWMSSVLGSIFFRFSQIQVCVVYAYSGLEKLRGEKWWQGEAIWDVLANFQIARWDFSWMSNFPFILSLATYATVLWEIYFPVLVWVPKCRRIILILGVFLHFGIGLTISIPFFAMEMISSYLLFLKSEEIDTMLNAVEFFSSRIKIKVVRWVADEFFV